MVVWQNTCTAVWQKNGRGQVNIFWHVLRAVYCLLGPKILVTPLNDIYHWSSKICTPDVTGATTSCLLFLYCIAKLYVYTRCGGALRDSNVKINETSLQKSSTVATYYFV